MQPSSKYFASETLLSITLNLLGFLPRMPTFLKSIFFKHQIINSGLIELIKSFQGFFTVGYDCRPFLPTEYGNYEVVKPFYQKLISDGMTALFIFQTFAEFFVEESLGNYSILTNQLLRELYFYYQASHTPKYDHSTAIVHPVQYENLLSFITTFVM